MEAIMQPIPFSRFAISAPRERAFISSTRGVTMSSVALVLALHLAALLAWISLPDTSPAPVSEMTAEIVIARAVQPEARPAPPPPPPEPAPIQRKTTPEPDPAPIEPVAQEMPVEQPPATVIAAAPDPVVAAAPAIAPVAPDVEPDYKASYLNNPRPNYPFAARRMGLQGKVVLNVEVLAEGLCGQVNVHQSSGHDMLDNAALQTVKTWKFIPASQAGRAVTKWFKIPIQFSLTNNET